MTFDVAAMIERIVPAAQYGGSTTANTEEAFDALVWNDTRAKPTWADLLQQVQLSQMGYQVYRYRDNAKDIPTVWPVDIDFITGLTRRLLPKNTFVFGELRQTIYYETRDVTGYHTPVVRETFEYTRDPETELPISRTNTIQWYYTDGVLDARAKVLVKHYSDDPISMLNELVRRRDNNIKNIIGAIIYFVKLLDPAAITNEILSEGRQFFFDHAIERNAYIQDGNLVLVDAIRQDTSLDFFNLNLSGITPFPTLRNYVIYQLTNGATAV